MTQCLKHQLNVHFAHNLTFRFDCEIFVFSPENILSMGYPMELIQLLIDDFYSSADDNPNYDRFL